MVWIYYWTQSCSNISNKWQIKNFRAAIRKLLIQFVFKHTHAWMNCLRQFYSILILKSGTNLSYTLHMYKGAKLKIKSGTKNDCTLSWIYGISYAVENHYLNNKTVF